MEKGDTTTYLVQVADKPCQVIVPKIARTHSHKAHCTVGRESRVKTFRVELLLQAGEMGEDMRDALN